MCKVRAPKVHQHWREAPLSLSPLHFISHKSRDLIQSRPLKSFQTRSGSGSFLLFFLPFSSQDGQGVDDTHSLVGLYWLWPGACQSATDYVALSPAPTQPPPGMESRQKAIPCLKKKNFFLLLLCPGQASNKSCGKKWPSGARGTGNWWYISHVLVLLSRTNPLKISKKHLEPTQLLCKYNNTWPGSTLGQKSWQKVFPRRLVALNGQDRGRGNWKIFGQTFTPKKEVQDTKVMDT